MPGWAPGDVLYEPQCIIHEDSLAPPLVHARMQSADLFTLGGYLSMSNAQWTCHACQASSNKVRFDGRFWASSLCRARRSSQGPSWTWRCTSPSRRAAVLRPRPQ